VRGRGSAIVFLPMGLAALVVGFLDTATALTDEARFLGIAFTMAGSWLLTTSWCLLAEPLRQNWGRTLSLSAGFVGMSLALYLALAQVGYPGGWRIYVWLPVASMALLAGLRRPSPAPPPAPALGGTPRTGSKAVTSVISIGTLGFLFTLGQFWYTNQYVPTKLLASLEVVTKLIDQGAVASNPSMRSLINETTLRNSSETKAQVVSSLYLLQGGRVEASDSGDFFAKLDPLAIDRTSQHVLYSASDILEFGKVVDDGSVFEPDFELSSQATITLPEDVRRTFASLRLESLIIVARGDRFSPSSFRPIVRPPIDPAGDIAQYAVVERRLDRVSIVRRFTRGDQAVAVVLYRFRGDKPRLVACVERPGLSDTLPPNPADVCRGSRLQRKFQAFYRLFSVKTVFETPVLSAS
jgi:hypothetical protein